MEREFNQADTDGDKKLTRLEWIKQYGSVAGFDAYDLDGTLCARES